MGKGLIANSANIIALSGWRRRRRGGLRGAHTHTREHAHSGIGVKASAESSAVMSAALQLLWRRARGEWSMNRDIANGKQPAIQCTTSLRFFFLFFFLYTLLLGGKKKYENKNKKKLYKGKKVRERKKQPWSEVNSCISGRREMRMRFPLVSAADCKAGNACIAFLPHTHQHNALVLDSCFSIYFFLFISVIWSFAVPVYKRRRINMYIATLWNLSG